MFELHRKDYVPAYQEQTQQATNATQLTMYNEIIQCGALMICAVWYSAVWYGIYLLLTEFEVHTVSFGPSFSPLIYGPGATRMGHKSNGEK